MRTSKRRFPDKTENEAKFYGIDWKAELKTDTVSTVAWSSNPSGLTFSNQSTSGSETKVKIAGGNEREEYAVTAKMTKATTGEICEAVVWLKVNPSDEVT